MATALQNLIDAYIKRNANQEITGPVLNGVLTAISNALGTPFIGSDGYWYTYDAETGQFVKTDTPAQGETGPVGVTEAAATIDDQIGTPSVAVSLNGTRLDFAFSNLKGVKGDTGNAGITAAVVTVDAGIGTPSVNASISGTTLTLAFHNLKGETGAAAGFGTIEATVDDTTGTPAVVVTESGPDTAKNLSFAFSGLKGAKGDQGNTGVSADYPITIANNLTTDDPTAALAASQGVVLKGEIDQLDLKVDEKADALKENEIDLKLGFKFEISGNGIENKGNLFFKKGVTYTCTHTSSVTGTYCIICDSNGNIVCGLSLVSPALTRTNTFTPSADIDGGYIKYLSNADWEVTIEPCIDITKFVDAHENTIVDAAQRMLKYGLDFYLSGNYYALPQIHGLNFKKGVTYTVTYTNDKAGAYGAICDSGGAVICGFPLESGQYSRTNTFTPNEDIVDGYADLWKDNYTLRITASKDLNGVVSDIKDSVADVSHKADGKVDVSCVNLYPAKNESPSTLLFNDGGTTAQTGYTTSDFVPVLPNTTYSTTSGQIFRKVCFYNKFKETPCLDNAQQTGTFTTPANCYYIRFSIYDANVGSVVLVIGGTTVDYTPYNPIEGYLNDVVAKDGEFSDNILDDSAVILLNKFMYNYGDLLDSNDYATLDYFEVKPNTEYSCSEECGTFRKVCCFDSNKTFISNGGFFENISTFTTPSNCTYVRVSVPMTMVDYLMITEGVNVKMYSPYNDAQGYLNHDGFTYLLVDEIKRMKMEEWSILRFGLFIHWGIYSAWEGKYDGLDIDGNEVHTTDGSEWMWWTYKIPKATYKAKAVDFTSAGWNPDKICRLAKSVGMRYIVLTIRHHEGFSLVPTPHCEWDINDSSASPDVVMQLKNACDRHGLKFCVYISALLDWNDDGGFDQDRWNNGSDPYTENEHLAFTDEQVAFCQQINDTYKPFLIWFDGGTYISQPIKVRRLFIKKQTAYFPFAITNDRGSHRTGDWYEVESGYADHPNFTKPLERCHQIAGWGYNASYDTPGIVNKLPSILFDMMEAMGRGFNYLLNVPPTGDGTITDNYVNWFNAAAAFFRKYTFFTDAKRLFNNCQPGWGRPIYRGNSVYLFILPGGNSNIYVDSIDTTNLTGVYVYNIQNPDSSANYEIIAEDRLLLKNVPTSSTDYYSVVRLDFNGAVLGYDYNIVDSAINPMSIVVVSRKEWPTISTGVDYSTKHYIIGEGNSVSRTRFKYSGETGTKTISLTMTSSGTNNIGFSIIDEETGVEQTGTGASISATLTNGHIYTMNITKSGDGNCDISNIVIS